MCLDTPICLDAHLYVWTPPCLYPPYILMHPYFWPPLCMFGCPPYVWLPHCMFGCFQMYGDIQRYERHPNIWWCVKHTGVSKHMGTSKCMEAYGHPLSLTKHTLFVLYMYSRHPNIFQTYIGHTDIWGASKHMGVSTHSQGVSKHRCAHIYRQYPNILGHPNIQGVI